MCMYVYIYIYTYISLPLLPRGPEAASARQARRRDLPNKEAAA